MFCGAAKLCFQLFEFSKHGLLQLEEPRWGSPSVAGAARAHWIPQLLQVNIVDMAILTINIIIITLVMMLKIAKCGQCSI